MLRMLPTLAACALLASASAQPVYKCRIDGTTAYGDQPCAHGPTQELTVPAAAPDAPTLARLARQRALAAQIDRRNAAQAERAARDERRAERSAAALRRRCDQLRLRQQWAGEDLRRASGRSATAAQTRLRRAGQSLAAACPG